jgi:hypothetical protein
MKKLAEYFVESEQGHIRPQVDDLVDIVVNEELAIEAGVLESTEDKLVLEYDERGISLLEGLDLIEEDADEDFTDLDETSCGMKKRYEDASAEEEDKFHTELDKLMHRTFGHSSDERGEKMKKSTQDAFEELKDYAETSGGIDKEEFEKAAYLVKAMGKPHLKDKAEGMLDDLIGKMDSDPRDKVIQVLARHIDLTFLKNLLDEAEYQGRTVKLNKPTRGDVKKFKVYVKDPKTGNVKKVNFGHGGTSAKRAGQKTMKIKKSNPARRKSFRARHNCDNPGPKTKARYWSCRAW